MWRHPISMLFLKSYFLVFYDQLMSNSMIELVDSDIFEESSLPI